MGEPWAFQLTLKPVLDHQQRLPQKRWDYLQFLVELTHLVFAV